MLEITKPAPNRIDIRLEGTLDAETMAKALDDLLALSEDVTNGRMLYTIPEFSMPTLGAIAVELRRLPKMFGLLGKFDRCAVLSDAAWLRTAAEIEGRLFPGIEIKSFKLDDVEAAEAWLAEG
ncbi:STAS/SEC14 domain-containing protein [Stappia sp. F7233]|uniref:STAS/SEC14 domain-containing protein n=2 Tax=Stappia albiluteola TaxID=2758565 RepID=A0A839AJ15_9HYPH|nr:STAS/SEC14 domain-containing protein [Stappia albiluteola]